MLALCHLNIEKICVLTASKQKLHNKNIELIFFTSPSLVILKDINAISLMAKTAKSRKLIAKRGDSSLLYYKSGEIFEI
jgi:hypothetical protein